MARELKPTELYNIIAKKTNMSEEKIKSIWIAFADTIVDEVATYGHIRMPFIGTLRTEVRGGKLLHIPNSIKDKERLNTDEPFRIEYVEPYIQINFKSADTFIENINRDSLTPYENRKQKAEIKKRKAIADEYMKNKEAYDKKMEKKEKAFEEIMERKKEEARLKKLTKQQKAIELEKEREEDYGY